MQPGGLSRFRLALSPGAAAILAAAMALWLALAAVTALLLWSARQNAIQQAKLRGTATTALLQAHTANTFRAVDNALVDVARTLERERLPRHDAGLRAGMRERLAAMPYVRALFVIGPDGRIQHDTDYPATPDVSLADRPYFQQYLHGDPPETPVSAPMLSRSGVGWFVAVTRRIGTGPQLRGVAVAAIQLQYFSSLYQEVGLDQGSEILLFHRDGRLIAQHPGSFGQIGENYAQLPLFRDHLRQANWGAYLTQAAPAPYPRVVNYAALAEVPLVVAQTQNMQEQLDAWRRWVAVSVAALLLLLASMLYGMTQYLRVRLERHRQQERLLQGEKMEALGQLTGSLAHDFGNILGIAAANISLIRKLACPEGQVEAALDRAQRALDNGTAITRQLMTFSRKRDLQVAEWDVNAAVSAALPLLEQAAGSQCEVVFEPGERLPPCRLDQTQLETALINLVVNARHAIEGLGRITISTSNVARRDLHGPSAVGDHRYVRVTVRDTGKGMPREVRRRALEPFYTTKGEEGTGLGLAQVYAFMQQLGGDVAIESRVGVGTAIHLFFPASPEGAGQQA